MGIILPGALNKTVFSIFFAFTETWLVTVSDWAITPIKCTKLFINRTDQGPFYDELLLVHRYISTTLRL